MRIITLFFIALCLISCTNKNTSPNTLQTVQAYIPVYLQTSSVNTIAVEAVRPTTNAGKIYAWGNYIFQVEENEGIHIIDNSSSVNAKKIAFLKVPLCGEISIKGNYLYTNNYKDLVVFDISTINSPILVKRLASVFPAINQNYPPYSNCYFQCADTTKGIVVKWVLQSVEQPNCMR